MSKVFAVMGATGHIGHAIAEDLLKRGHTVRAFGRDEHKLHQITIKGAQPIIGNFDDANVLTKGFEGAHGVFCMIPPGYKEKNYATYQDRVSKAICQAIQKAQIDRVVNLSSIGANLGKGTGPIDGLARLEKQIDGLKKYSLLVHLRPSAFMENLQFQLPMIMQQNVFRSSIKGDLPIPMVATRDIAWKTADFLDSTAPQPHLIFEFVGPHEVTYNQSAKLFGRALDKDVRYEQISYEQEKKDLISYGIATDMADMMVEMNRAFNEGRIKPTQELKPTHHGTTTLEEYIQMLVHRNLAAAKK